MTIAVVPVNELGRAKSRLAQYLTAHQRRGLTLAMLRDVLGTLLAVPEVSRVLVVSRDATVLQAARAVGAEAWREEAGSLNGALTEVAVALAGSQLLVVPADVPRVSPADVQDLVACAPVSAGNTGPNMVIVPSRDGGTGALLVHPAGAVPFRFGPGSCAAHLAAAQAQGIPCRVFCNPHFALDIDGEEDLHQLWLAGEAGAATRRCLESLMRTAMRASRRRG